MIVSTTSNLSFLGFGFVGNSNLTHLVENGCFFLVCIGWELAAHAVVGEVMADATGEAVYDRVSILIISISATVLLGGSFGFRWCGLSTIFLVLNFCDVDFCHKSVYFGSEFLVF